MYHGIHGLHVVFTGSRGSRIISLSGSKFANPMQGRLVYVRVSRD